MSRASAISPAKVLGDGRSVSALAVPDGQAAAQLQEALQQANAEKARWEGECDAEQSKVESLRQQLADAHAAVMGYHMDCANCAGRTSSLEAEVAQLQEENAVRRASIQVNSKTGDMLQDQLDDLRTRCETLNKCKAEFSTSLATGAVADEAMQRYLSFHLQEAKTRLTQTSNRVTSQHNRIKALAKRNDELEKQLKEHLAAASCDADSEPVDIEKLKPLLVALPAVVSEVPEQEAGGMPLSLPSPPWTFRASSPATSDSEAAPADPAALAMMSGRAIAPAAVPSVQPKLADVDGCVVASDALPDSATTLVDGKPPNPLIAALVSERQEGNTSVDKEKDLMTEMLRSIASLRAQELTWQKINDQTKRIEAGLGFSEDSSVAGSAAVHGSVAVSAGPPDAASASVGQPVGSGRSAGEVELGCGPPNRPNRSPRLASAASSSAGSDVEPTRSVTVQPGRSWNALTGTQSARVGGTSGGAVTAAVSGAAPHTLLEPGMAVGRVRGVATNSSPYSAPTRSPRMHSRARSPGAAVPVVGSTSPGQSRGSAAHRSPAGSGSASGSARHFASSRSASPQQHTPSPPQSPSLATWRIHRRSKPGVSASVVLGSAPLPAQSQAPIGGVAVGGVQRTQTPLRGRCQLEVRRQQLCDHICQLQALHTELRYLDNILTTATLDKDPGLPPGFEANLKATIPPGCEANLKSATVGERLEASLAPLLCTLGAAEPLDTTASPAVPALRLACNRLRVLVEPWASAGNVAGEADTTSVGGAPLSRAVLPSTSPGVAAVMR